MASVDFEGKKRTIKACDRCRLKKVKCDGMTPCARCQQDDTICQFNVRSNSDGKSVSAAHVNQLQAHNDILAKALKSVWTRYAVPVVGESSGTGLPWSTHEIVRKSGVLDEQSLGHIQGSLNFDNPGAGLTESPDEQRSKSDDRDFDSNMNLDFDNEQQFPNLNYMQDWSFTNDPSMNGAARMPIEQSYDPFSQQVEPSDASNTLNRPNRPKQKLAMPQSFQSQMGAVAITAQNSSMLDTIAPNAMYNANYALQPDRAQMEVERVALHVSDTRFSKFESIASQPCNLPVW